VFNWCRGGGKLGLMVPVGHADFYPNSGEHHMPGCFNDINSQYNIQNSYCTWKNIFENELWAIFVKTAWSIDRTKPLKACSHSRAYEYYVESVKELNSFLGCQCSSWTNFDSGLCPCKSAVVMGDATPQR